jgi:single-stranded DNA-binding protein
MSAANINIVGKIFKVDSTASGNTPIAKVTIPIDTGFGERKVTTWWTAKFFGKSAEAVLRSLQKGDWVTISGSASVNTWTARDGSTRANAEVDATNFQRVGPRVPREATPPERSDKRSTGRPGWTDETNTFLPDDDF